MAVNLLNDNQRRRLGTHLRLLVSELVTNSIRHGNAVHGRPVELGLELDRSMLRVWVVDRGPGFEPHRPTPDPEEPSGWGLYLVDRIADRYAFLLAQVGTGSTPTTPRP